MPDRTARIQAIFAQASQLTGEARDACVQRECGDDHGLRTEVEELLRLDEESPFLGEGRLARLREHLRDGADPLPTSIGPFRIEAVLGRGGMGVVYRAVQDHPPRAVALKVLAPGMASAPARARFALEAEVLGRLQHPGIATVYAAGTWRTPAGDQPYLAMELVDGEPLTTFVARTKPPLAGRLHLLEQLCAAVHHAHQKGVIHRDLKPGNVLVDRQEQVKVLDFGIARFLADDRERTLQTLTGQVLGTLAYMSPEQANGDHARIDIRTDVWSLGVLGYELLTGALPIEVAGQPFTVALRQLNETDPVPLGVRDHRLRGDLQTIFAMALRREPERRYDSAQAFADDLRRFAAHEPIRARPATAGYLLRRFARRHVWLLTAITAIVAGLAVALLASLRATDRVETARQLEWAARQQAEADSREAHRQARIKDAVLQVVQDVFMASDPSNNPEARQQTVAERFATATAGLEARFQDEPATGRAVRLALAKTMNGLGEHAAAASQLTNLRLAAGADRDFAIEVAFELANALWRDGQIHDALAVADQLEQRIGSGAGAEHATRRNQLDSLRGQILFAQGQIDAAEALWRATLERGGTAPGFDDSLLAATLRISLAGVLLERKDFAAAEPMVRTAAATLARIGGADAASTLAALNSLASAEFGRGNFAIAERLLTEVTTAWTRVFGAEHPTLMDLLQNRAAACQRSGNSAEAERLFRDARTLGERLFGPDSWRLAPVLANLGNMRWQTRQLDEAAALYERAIAVRQTGPRRADRLLSGYLYDLARIRRDQGDADKHLQLLRQSLAVRIEALGAEHELVVPRRVELAAELLRRNDPRGAVDELTALDPRLPAILGRDHKAAIASARLLAEGLLALGERDRVPACLQVLTERAAGTPQEAEMRSVVDRIAAQLGTR